MFVMRHGVLDEFFCYNLSLETLHPHDSIGRKHSAEYISVRNDSVGQEHSVVTVLLAESSLLVTIVLVEGILLDRFYWLKTFCWLRFCLLESFCWVGYEGTVSSERQSSGRKRLQISVTLSAVRINT